MSKRLRVMTKSVVDRVSGEVISVDETQVSLSYRLRDSFYLTYPCHSSLLYSCGSLLELFVIFRLLELAEYNTNRVLLSPDIRDSLIVSLGTSPRSFFRAMRHLRSVGLLSGRAPVFYINPLVFWKGTEQERSNRLRSYEDKFNFSFDELSQSPSV